MSYFKDLTGNKYNRLVVISFNCKKVRTYYWDCKCDCGNVSVVNGAKLKAGTTKSCGCFRDEKIAKQGKKRATHRMGDHRLYTIWRGIKYRCNNSNATDYSNYGLRGIKVCDEWNHKNGFIPFYNWAMENGYSEDFTIDRKDVNGNYEPSNCKWASFPEQCRNKRTNRFIDYNGESLCLTDWATRYNISRHTISSRIEAGWSIERSLTTPAGKRTYANKEVS